MKSSYQNKKTSEEVFHCAYARLGNMARSVNRSFTISLVISICFDSFRRGAMHNIIMPYKAVFVKLWLTLADELRTFGVGYDKHALIKIKELLLFTLAL
jgi:hypothetical protein